MHNPGLDASSKYSCSRVAWNISKRNWMFPDSP